MRAINDFVIVDQVNDGPKEVGGLILTDKTDADNRYKKANIITKGELVTMLNEGDEIYYDKFAGHSISFEDKLYRCIRVRDIVLVG